MTPSAHLVGYAFLIATPVTFGYVIACAFAPFGRCRRCHSDGRLGSSTRRFRRPCPRCDGTGRRVRVGRRAFTYLRNEHDRGTK